MHVDIRKKLIALFCLTLVAPLVVAMLSVFAMTDIERRVEYAFDDLTEELSRTPELSEDNHYFEIQDEIQRYLGRKMAASRLMVIIAALTATLISVLIGALTLRSLTAGAGHGHMALGDYDLIEETARVLEQTAAEIRSGRRSGFHQ